MTYFERIKYYYDLDYWTKEQVKKAVEYDKISALEYETIIGEPYIA